MAFLLEIRPNDLSLRRRFLRHQCYCQMEPAAERGRNQVYFAPRAASEQGAALPRAEGAVKGIGVLPAGN
ncbi:MAG TPA: hypothetical protein VIY51_06570 [Xanthobacteraceae bacterium]